MRQVRLNKESIFEASHRIPGHVKCGRLHGHSYRVIVSISGTYHKKYGMLVDFGLIKSIINKFDHSYLNDFFKIPSAENLAIYFALKIARLNRNIEAVTVTVYETETSCASYTYFNVGKEGE